MTSRVTVVGSGVSGLTCALNLRRAGFDAHIVTAALPPDTTSAMAAAVWTIPGSGPGSRTFGWALRSREEFESLAADSAAGVAVLRQREVGIDAPRLLGWEDDFPWIRRLNAAELPHGYRSGWLIEGFRIEPLVYLSWLLRHFEALGGSISVQRMARLGDAEGLVVNCAGLGARELCNDAELVPIRGQVVVVPNPGIVEGISDEEDPHRIAYVYPRNDKVILGGTRDVGEWDLTPDLATTERILADCRRLEPRLVEVEALEARVGLRPGRAEVRLEEDRLADGRPVIHNYGHGGMGYILSWGCADEVVALARGV